MNPCTIILNGLATTRLNNTTLAARKTLTTTKYCSKTALKSTYLPVSKNSCAGKTFGYVQTRTFVKFCMNKRQIG